MFQRTCHNVLIFARKTTIFKKYNISRFFSYHSPWTTNKNDLKFIGIFASATAISLSVFIAYKRNALSENLHVNDDKYLNLISEGDCTYDEAIRKSRDLLQSVKDEIGAPGLVVGVSINGKTVWAEGLGYSDVENRVQCSPDTVMRIASISKSITMAAVAKLWEQGKLDLDKPIQEYVPYFPSKSFNGKPVTVTCRQLVSHLGGIRHYEKNSISDASKKKDTEISSENSKKKSEFEHEEYYIKENFKDIKSTIDLFKDDPLIGNPGSKFYYSTHGWTLISAIIEGATKEQFTTYITKLFRSLGMSSTYLDVNDTLIYNRSRNYIKDKKGHLINAPYVDNSYKWAGGGFLSTVGDLLQFGNLMLYSYQFKSGLSSKNVENKNMDSMNKNIASISGKRAQFVSSNQILPGFLSSKTVEVMWTPAAESKKVKYGMGWFIFPEVHECQFCENKKFSVYHTGGAIGASSVLFILPESSNELNDCDPSIPPKGIIVTILTNLQSVSLNETASKIAEIFYSQMLHK